jgi:cyclohexanecarboxylate-CoA ligase
MNFEPILPPARVSGMKRLGFWRDRLLLDDLDAAAARSPGAPAITDDNSVTGQRTVLTWRELARRVECIAVGLARLGIERGDVVSYQLPNWWQFAALHLACLRIGAAANPLMPIFRERELTFMLNLAESKVLVVPRRYRDFDYPAMAAGLRAHLPRLKHVVTVLGEGGDSFEALLLGTQAQPGEAAALFAGRRLGPDDVIQVLYTSGTTGEPKGVMHTSNTLFSNLTPYIGRLGLSGSDVVLMASPLAHQTGFMYGVMMPVALGCPVVLQDLWNADRAADRVAGEGVTFTMASTPFLADLTDCAERRPEAFRSLRIFLAAGAPIPRVLVRRAREHLGAHIVSAWGMTENGAVTTTKLDDPPQQVFESDGCALPGMELRTVDALSHPLPVGEEGRLQVRGCSNFVGYLKRPSLYGTDAEGWFDTGDLARLDAEGYVRITGRSKDIIIRGGENIPVVEIEGILYRHPGVAEVAIVAMPDARLGERACAFVVPKGGASLSLPDLAAFLQNEKVAKQYIPERVEIVPELPKTPSGKVQKFRLREAAKGFAAAG